MAVSMSQSLNNLRLDLLRQRSIVVDRIRDKNDFRAHLIRKIECVTLKIIKAIADNRMPHFESINFNKADNCFFNERLRLKNKNDLRKRKISFGLPRSRHRFAVIIFLLSKIHKLLSTFKVNTRREIYYGNIELFQSQNEVDDAMRDVCYILSSPPWELGVISTVKGIVAGPLLFKLGHDNIIHCDKPGGVLIPPNILEVELISKGIQWVIIIENDAAFQNIICTTGLSKLKEYLFITHIKLTDTQFCVSVKIIFKACPVEKEKRTGSRLLFFLKEAYKHLVFQIKRLLPEDLFKEFEEVFQRLDLLMGKGFPDIHTRLLVCRLWECFKLPILALVDADPYGLEIMCVYRFGSVKSCLFSDRLACPPVRWLGIHPSDLKLMAMDFTNLSEKEFKKISRIADRSYIKENEKIKNEVQILIDKNMKAKIEGISNISLNYITNVYIPSKITRKKYF